jgi:hypothetical protein
MSFLFFVFVSNIDDGLYFQIYELVHMHPKYHKLFYMIDKGEP